MKRTNSFSALIAIAVGLMTVFGCSQFRTMTETATTTNTATSNGSTTTTNTSTTAAKSDAIEPADFTVTAEQLDKEYTRKGVTDKDLEKYQNKNIAVTGRVSMLVTEKKDTTQPWVTLWAPGTLHGVNCYFDDEHVGEMKKLTMDKPAKIQGFQDDFITPEISPMLKHCRVLD